MPSLSAPVVLGKKQLPGPLYSHQPPQQHTGTYYDAELASALAAYLPGAPTAPSQRPSAAIGMPSLSRRAVTTAHNEPALTVVRAVRTGIAPRPSDEASDVSMGAPPPTLLSSCTSVTNVENSSATLQDWSCSEDIQRQPSCTASSAVENAWTHQALGAQRMFSATLESGSGHLPVPCTFLDSDMDIVASLFDGWSSEEDSLSESTDLMVPLVSSDPIVSGFDSEGSSWCSKQKDDPLGSVPLDLDGDLEDLLMGLGNECDWLEN